MAEATVVEEVPALIVETDVPMAVRPHAQVLAPMDVRPCVMGIVKALVEERVSMYQQVVHAQVVQGHVRPIAIDNAH